MTQPNTSKTMQIPDHIAPVIKASVNVGVARPLIYAKPKIEKDNGSVLSVDFDCPEYVKAGDTVTFTLTLVDLSDRFDDYTPVEITAVRVQDGDGEELAELEELNGYSGQMNTVGKQYYFSFTIPENYTQEYVTVMVYLMTI